MGVRFAIELLAKAQKRADFISGNDRTDSGFQEIVAQDVKRKYVTCFVQGDRDDRVAGLYMLSSTNIPLNEVPGPLARRG